MTRKPTRKEMASHLAKVEAEYKRVMAEIDRSPEGNGFATQEECRRAAVLVYVSTIGTLRRRLGLY